MPNSVVFTDEQKSLLRWLVDELPPLEQEVINALFYEGVSAEVVGKRLGTSRWTVLRIRARALKGLGAVMEELVDAS